MNTIYNALVDTFAFIDSQMDRGGTPGVPTGFSDLDRITGGLHPSELTILASRPSMGKSALAMNIADYVAVQCDASVLFVAIEESRLEVSVRMLCSGGEIDSKRFRGGYLSEGDRERLIDASKRLAKSPLFIDDSPRRTVAEIAASVELLQGKGILALAIIDNLNLIEPRDRSSPREDQIGEITRDLKRLTRETGVPILLLSQLNRGFPDMERRYTARGNRPDLCHIRGSGVVEECADVVMFIHRDEYYMTRQEAKEQNVLGRAEVIVAKQRNGPIGSVVLQWCPEFMKFKTIIEPRHDEFDASSVF